MSIVKRYATISASVQPSRWRASSRSARRYSLVTSVMGCGGASRIFIYL
jgi:hypothetical protein